jgi:membrane protease YdiL (CAAX protease family)
VLTLAGSPSPPVAVALGVAASVALPVAWFLVRLERVSVWSAMGTIMGVLGLLGIAFGRVHASTELDVQAAAGLGAGAGLALYAATAAFMFVAGRWPPLGRQAHRIYELRGGRSLPAALAVACLAVAPGEEIVWRGLVQPTLAAWLGPVGGALAAWGAYVAVNASSASIPIVLGAVVGGAAWSGLALATGGVVAPILCHAVWTGLMLVLPPVFEGRR